MITYIHVAPSFENYYAAVSFILRNNIVAEILKILTIPRKDGHHKVKVGHNNMCYVVGAVSRLSVGQSSVIILCRMPYLFEWKPIYFGPVEVLTESNSDCMRGQYLRFPLKINVLCHGAARRVMSHQASVRQN